MLAIDVVLFVIFEMSQVPCQGQKQTRSGEGCVCECVCARTCMRVHSVLGTGRAEGCRMLDKSDVPSACSPHSANDHLLRAAACLGIEGIHGNQYEGCQEDSLATSQGGERKSSGMESDRLVCVGWNGRLVSCESRGGVEHRSRVVGRPGEACRHH